MCPPEKYFKDNSVNLLKAPFAFVDSLNANSSE